MSNTNKRSGTGAKASVEIDPSASGTIIRIVSAAESTFNILLAIPMVFNAEKAFQRMYLTDDPSAAPLAAPLMQLCGISLAAMTVPIMLGIPNKAGAVETRRITYQMLASFEAMAFPLLFWQAWLAGEAGSGIFPTKLTWGSGLAMGVTLGFRVFVLFMKPEWMGKYQGGVKLS
ncbi:amidohydrolase family [Fusarium mundagurra]|uniref:Amidohydrolase family n=1 Tax=Fusarium mundagurra TaxID=1567541 RepID=A0A8H6DIF7_9HYPO|nr:amidohydrolase family [Fusarium mundagurra]